jgi:hypothetical protein
MAILKTGKRTLAPGSHGLEVNFLAAYEPLPEDKYFVVVIRSDEARYEWTRPIEKYQSTIKWARKLVELLTCPIDLLTITEKEHQERLKRPEPERWPSFLIKPA